MRNETQFLRVINILLFNNKIAFETKIQKLVLSAVVLSKWKEKESNSGKISIPLALEINSTASYKTFIWICLYAGKVMYRYLHKN